MRKQIRMISVGLVMALAVGSLAGCSKKTSDDPVVVMTETPAVTKEEPAETTPAETEPVTVEETTRPAVSEDDNLQVSSNGVTLMNIVTVKAGEVDSYGYAVYPCEMTGTYHFEASNSENTEWKVYVLDKEFDGSLDELSSKNQPVLEGDGKITVRKGQYIYVYCSANETTQETADQGAAYQFGIEVITK